MLLAASDVAPLAKEDKAAKEKKCLGSSRKEESERGQRERLASDEAPKEKKGRVARESKKRE